MGSVIRWLPEGGGAAEFAVILRAGGSGETGIMLGPGLGVGLGQGE